MSEGKAPRIIALGNGVWLDEIRNEGVAPIKDVPGGSVTFGMLQFDVYNGDANFSDCEATLGARFFTPHEPSSIAMVFNAGVDFPAATTELLRSWDITLTVHHHSDKPSSRGLVFYEKANGNSTLPIRPVARIVANERKGRGFSVSRLHCRSKSKGYKAPGWSLLKLSISSVLQNTSRTKLRT